MNNNDVYERLWDYIVVGTGVGGGTVGYALARNGCSVLFLERGQNPRNSPDALKGVYPETMRGGAVAEEHDHETLLRGGRYSLAIEDLSGGRSRRHVPFLGMGVGGSSALYGMAMERFHRDDFEPGHHYGLDTGANIPEVWPVSYFAMEPYYKNAETLFGVCGESDPMRSPIDLPAPPKTSQAAQELMKHLERRGCHPYRLPLACKWVPGCRGCQGFLCDRECKNDSAGSCVEPACRDHGAHLLDRCEVIGLEADSRSVKAVHAMHRGEGRVFRAKRVILAVGALATPALLLQSRNVEWPYGLGNRHDQVGRYLMRHCVDLYAVPTIRAPEKNANLKELACSDFYVDAGKRLGSLQSFGALPPGAMIAAQLIDDLRRDGLEWAAALMNLASPIVGRLMGALFGRLTILAGTLEDLPYADNRVLLGKTSGALCFTYKVHAHETDRIRLFRKKISDVLRPYPCLLIKQAENNDRLAHVCGTCRFGDDPRSSVLDVNNCVHGMNNLYVVDASFMPTSAAINPALTIAANALRVADNLV